MFRKPIFWVMFVVLVVACTAFAVTNFPRSFSIVELELEMDRGMALEESRRLADQFGWGPSDYRQVASFRLDERARSCVELEAGGPAAFKQLLRGGPFRPYHWRVRHFRAGDLEEVTVWFSPTGVPYGFSQRLSAEVPGAALDVENARTVAENGVGFPWNVDIDAYDLVESSEEEQPGGRVDHTFVYERPDVGVGAGRFRLLVVVSGDRVSELRHLLQIPEAFDRRYEAMRSVNNGIGAAGSLAVVLIYGVGGIGIALFLLLRQRWVLWRKPLLWGSGIAVAQLLAGLNQWPLLWMNYDTSVSQTTFILEQATLLVLGSFAYAGIFTLSFMAAESLSRRAFPHHLQFWQVWSTEAARSWQVLGQTVAGYLIVGIDLAFLVAFYWFAGEILGWWSPSDALLNPDSLAMIFPWLNPLALSLQAGFWEECLFRAIPLAGAALLGNRFGHRRVWIVGAFVFQIIIFGAGHAGYPTQPGYARLVELIVPSAMFGLLYLRFGLLPGIVMHFAFDAVLFSMPLFVSTAPGTWMDRGIFVILFLTPLWVVLKARLTGGPWCEASPAFQNRAWRPVKQEVEKDPACVGLAAPGNLPPFLLVTVLGVLGLGLWMYGAVVPTESPRLEVGRAEAVTVARQAMHARGIDTTGWQEFSTVEGEGYALHRFVWSEMGEDTFRDLLGVYLPTPRWYVRYARFEGDVVARAEEYGVYVGTDGGLSRFRHQMAEGAPGASLSEGAARLLAEQALAIEAQDIARRAGEDGVGRDLQEIRAESLRLPARVDWRFEYRDHAVESLGSGEARIFIAISGDEVVSVGRSVYLPEDWRRREDQREATMGIIGLASLALVGILLVGGAVTAVVRWTRGYFNLRVALVASGLVFSVTVLTLANEWQSVLIGMSTAQPLQLQLGLAFVGGLVGEGMMATIIGLLAGHAYVVSAGGSAGNFTRKIATGSALGFAFLGGTTLVGLILNNAVPPWSDYGPADAVFPWLAAGLPPVVWYLTLTLLGLVVVTSVNALTAKWTKRRPLGVTALVVIGASLAVGGPSVDPASWAISGVSTGLLLLAMYLWVLRVHPTLIVPAVAALVIPQVLEQGLEGAYGGALPGSLLAVAGISLVGWTLFRRLSLQTSVSE